MKGFDGKVAVVTGAGSGIGQALAIELGRSGAKQGAWPTFGLTLPEMLPEKLTGLKRISRRAMSAPSSGSSKVHAVEQQEILDEAFA